MDKATRYYAIVQKGVALLADKQEYKQSNLLNKLLHINKAVSASTLSNIVNGRNAGLPMLKKAAEGIAEIVGQELGMVYSKDTHEYAPAADPAWRPYIIPESPDLPDQDTGMEFHLDGRVSIQQKTNFIATAQKEVIEVGIRLRTFSEYFISRKETEYKSYIISLLQKGVVFKAYLLDPESNIASMYFEDRARAQESEKEALVESRKVLVKLKQLVQEFAALRHPGSFEIYLYRHVPYNHFLVVDPGLHGARMMISHYIYGIRRAECPVWEFSRSKQPALFDKYFSSLSAYLKDARPLQ